MIWKKFKTIEDLEQGDIVIWKNTNDFKEFCLVTDCGLESFVEGWTYNWMDRDYESDGNFYNIDDEYIGTITGYTRLDIPKDTEIYEE